MRINEVDYCNYMESCGWRKGRDVNYRMEPTGKIHIFSAADAILREFYGLEFKANKNCNAPYDAYDVIIDPSIRPGNWDDVKRKSLEISSRLYPVAAVADNQVAWYVSEEGAIYRLYMEFEFVGRNFVDSLIDTTHGFLPPPNW